MVLSHETGVRIPVGVPVKKPFTKASAGHTAGGRPKKAGSEPNGTQSTGWVWAKGKQKERQPLLALRRFSEPPLLGWEPPRQVPEPPRRLLLSSAGLRFDKGLR